MQLRFSRAGWSVRHHSFVSYCLYTIGFVVFVVSLKARMPRNARARSLRALTLLRLSF